MGRKKREEAALIEVWDETTLFIGFTSQRLLPTGRILGVMPMLHGEAQLVLSFPLPVCNNRIANCWHYMTREQATLAYEQWPADDDGGGQERYTPPGWCWHPSTGRYRLGGDPGREYILSDDSRSQGTIDAGKQKVGRAVQITLGQGWRIKDIDEQKKPLGLYEECITWMDPALFRDLVDHKAFRKSTYPPKTRFFLVSCQKGEEQQTFAIYHALDRSVVIEQGQLIFMTLAQILERLTVSACGMYT